jgi:tRNA nucleotidyltransferase/poly(A) polymerase
MAESPGVVPSVSLERVPDDVVSMADALARTGHCAVLVGACVRDLLRDADPRELQLLTDATFDTLVRLFERGVPTHAGRGIVMVPRPGGPVDVMPLRYGDLASELAHRDFTLNAIAYDPRVRTLVDPCDGSSDWMKGRLRAVGDAAARMKEDPLRALRAARFVATLGVTADPEIEDAMRAVAPRLRDVAAGRLRWELCTLLLAPGAGDGLELLERTGITEQLAAGASKHGPAIVARLPAELELRLAAWVRGARTLRALRNLRFPRPASARVEQLLAWHPIEGHVSPDREASVRRLLRRAGDGPVDQLVAWRRAEIAVDAGAPHAAEEAERLDRIADAIAELRREGVLARGRQQLAVDGAKVMEILGTGPGPAVGRALRYLTERITRDPGLNREETLRTLLEEWQASQGGSS